MKIYTCEDCNDGVDIGIPYLSWGLHLCWKHYIDRLKIIEDKKEVSISSILSTIGRVK